METLGKHPNALVAGSTGTSGVLVVYVLGLLGVEVEPVAAAALVAAASSAALLIGRKGFRGIFRSIWRGSESE